MSEIKEMFKRWSFLRFLIVGGSATLLDYIIYWFLSDVINFNVAKGISMLCSSIYSYFLNKHFTFRAKQRSSVQEVAKYIFAQLINIGTNVGINYLLFTATDIKLLSMVFATGVAMIVNYILQKLFVFKTSVEERVKMLFQMCRKFLQRNK